VTVALTLLALDAALAACSAALWRDGAVVARRLEQPGRGHAERLMLMVEEVMAEGGLAYGALDALAVTVGPGTFTGVRIGLATARGLALALGRPLAGVTTCEAIACAVEPGGPFAVVLGAGREHLYVQAFAADGLPAGEPALLARAEAEGALAPGLRLAGDAAEGLVAAHPARGWRAVPPALPDAARIAGLVAGRRAAGMAWPEGPPAPLYLRPPDARLPAGAEGAP
jgi:tRNA threonylcarbamoyladenosine biosynthesis protein TsaB